MESDDLSQFAEFCNRLPDLSEVPPELHSDYHEGPFSACTVCGKKLSDTVVYEIQKVYRAEECLLEIAICANCIVKLSSELSQESKQAIANFRLVEREYFANDQCGFCRLHRKQFRNYTVLGGCRKESLIIPVVFVCETCGDRTNELLSEKTHGFHEDFMRDYLPGVPADLDLAPSMGSLL